MANLVKLFEDMIFKKESCACNYLVHVDIMAIFVFVKFQRKTTIGSVFANLCFGFVTM
jgi:hypothetical protein